MRQPWGWALGYGKSPENRSTNIAGDYRGPLAIHSSAPKSKAGDRAYVDEALASSYADWASLKDRMTWEVPLVMGAVLSVVELVSVHHASDHGENEADVCSPWAMPGQWHLVVENPRPLAVPVPAKGRLGLWTPDADLLAQIREQVTW